jgi:Bacterial PH domain
VFEQSAPVAIRSGAARAAALFVWLITLIGLVTIVRVDRGWGLVFGVECCALIALLIWIGAWRPAIQIDDDAVTLVNLVHDVRVPWERLNRVNARFSVVLTTADATHAAWAVSGQAPRSSFQRRGGLLSGGLGRMGSLSTDLTSEQPASDTANRIGQNSAEGAAAQITSRWLAVCAFDADGDPIVDLNTPEVLVTPRLGAPIALGVLVVLTVLTSLFL